MNNYAGGSSINLRLKKNENELILDWLNQQDSLIDSLRFLIEQSIQQYGVIDLSSIIPTKRLILPTAKELEAPLLEEFYKLGMDKEAHISEFYDVLAEKFDLDENIRNIKATTTSEPQFNNNIRWSKEALKNKGFVESFKRGYWKITERGYEYYKKNYDDVKTIDGKK